MNSAIHLFDRLPQVEVAQEPAKDRSATPVRAEPLIGLIRNQQSYGNAGRPVDYGDVPGVMVASPTRRSELNDILADFAAKGVDYIAIDGGDGTVRDVLTCGAGYFGDNWPALIVLPSGKTNALAQDLGIAKVWTLAEALDAAKRKRTAFRQPIVISQHDNAAAQVRGFVMGAGIYTTSISLGQNAHRFGAFNAAAVGVTTIWTVLQVFFGSKKNSWRRGTAMRLHDDNGNEIEHAGGAPADERFFMLASTLRTLPAGLRPFKNIDETLRLVLFDNPRRRLLLRLPFIYRGNVDKRARKLGFHTYGLKAFDFEVGGRFILDGEAFPPGNYRVTPGPRLRFIVP